MKSQHLVYNPRQIYPKRRPEPPHIGYYRRRLSLHAGRAGSGVPRDQQNERMRLLHGRAQHGRRRAAGRPKRI